MQFKHETILTHSDELNSFYTWIFVIIQCNFHDCKTLTIDQQLSLEILTLHFQNEKTQC